MEKGSFVSRGELQPYEWREGGRNWQWPRIEKEVMDQLLTRSTLNGLLRVFYFVALLLGVAGVFLMALLRSPWLALIPLYGYYFLYGFWVAVAHELQHSTVFARSANRFNEVVFFMVQTLMWNSPTYARKSHQLHHRYTMVRGLDPETQWPARPTTRWLRGVLIRALSRVLVIGALKQLLEDARLQVVRAMGNADRMVLDHCTPAEQVEIRRESLGILIFHIAVIAVAVAFHRWELLLLVTIAWQIGSAFEGLWHDTEHIGRLYNVNDQSLCTRSVRVGPFIGSIYWGLDHHIDHHLFPAVPSRNLPKLHELLKQDLPEPQGVLACWREMFKIARQKDQDPQLEYVPVGAPRPR